MGQCSTLPADNLNGPESDNSSMDKSKRSSISTSAFHHARQQRDDGSSYMKMKDGINEDHPMTEEDPDDLSSNSKTRLLGKKGKAEDTNNFFVDVARQAPNTYEPYSGSKQYSESGHPSSHRAQNNESNFKENQSPQSRHSRRTSRDSRMSTPSRQPVLQQQTPPEPIPQPPDSAVRMRCYRLNLESSMDPSVPHKCGPIEARNRLLQISISEDSSVAGGSSHNVAQNTAQIFRGITIARDGTIHSKKLGRSSRSQNGGKADEKSRQAAKIDKAKDLVEESANGKIPGNQDEDTKMVSLIIMGEYDDMKHLVREGSKRLKDSEGLPDEALLSQNAKRYDVGPEEPVMTPLSPSREDTRKRSPNRGGPSYSPVKTKIKSPQAQGTLSQHNRSFASNVPAVMPRLKENPRDTRPLNSRQKSQSSRRLPSEKCTIFGAGGDESNWSDALGFNFQNIWSCGATKGDPGTISPNNNNMNGSVVSQHHPHYPHHHAHHGSRTNYYAEHVTERRDESSIDYRM